MFYAKFQLVILYTSLSVIFTKAAHNFCEVYIDKNSGIIPRFEINIGESIINKSLINDNFLIGDGITVTGYCETFFSKWFVNEPSIPPPGLRQNIELRCSENGLVFDNQQVRRPFFGCSKLNWDIFYTNSEQFSWCNNKSNATTMFIMSNVNERYIAFAKLCYNFKADTLRNIEYTVQYSGKTNSEMIMDMKVMDKNYYEQITDDLRLSRLENALFLTNELFQQNILNLTISNKLLSFANFEISPLVLGNSYAKYFNEFNDLLNTIWWRNLRVGNWKLFIDTLENNAKDNKFRILTGSLGKLEIPQDMTNKNKKVLELKFNSKNINIPAYIWSYVKSTDGKNKDFFIFGYNSPYAEFFSSNDIIFCPDICSEITWLKDVYMSFRIRLTGLIFCCNPDSVKNLDIDGIKVENIIHE